jgi:hypothetical protein
MQIIFLEKNLKLNGFSHHFVGKSQNIIYIFFFFSQQKGRIGLERKRGGLAQIGSNAKRS